MRGTNLKFVTQTAAKEVITLAPDEQPKSQQATFCLVHGAWHGAWCWDLVKPILEQQGHNVITPNLPITTKANFNAYAQVVADCLKKESTERDLGNVVLVGHSRMGNVVTRVPDMLSRQAGHIALTQMIYVAASIEEYTIGRPLVEEFGQVPEKNVTLSSLTPPETVPGRPDLLIYAEDLARFNFYHDCDDDVADWAVSNLRPQHKADNEPKVKRMPGHDIDAHFIVCAFDRVISTDRQIYTALNWFNVPEANVSVFPTGHSPMLAQPEEFAAKLDEIYQTS